MHRFLRRLWRLIIDETTGETLTAPPTEPAPAPEPGLLASHPGYPRGAVARLIIVPGKVVNVVLQ